MESIQCYWKELLSRISKLTTYEVTRNTTLVEIKVARHSELQPVTYRQISQNFKIQQFPCSCLSKHSVSTSVSGCISAHLDLLSAGLHIIQRNKTIHFYRNYFLSDSECPQTEDPHRNFCSPKQTVVIGLFYRPKRLNLSFYFH